MSSNIPTPQIKILWVRSGNFCAMPDCLVKLVAEKKADEPEAAIGEMAHIYGEKSGSARYSAEFPKEKINSCDNLILICPNHHTEIDKQPAAYPAEKLIKIKNDHENHVRKILEKEMLNITYFEIEAVTNYLISSDADTTTDMSIIPLQEKIRKNGLSVSIQNLIKMGLIQSVLVNNFIEQNTDVGFGERLKRIFIIKYNELRLQENSGDELFEILSDFASGGDSSTKKKAAGLAVLTYFFEACEVFER